MRYLTPLFEAKDKAAADPCALTVRMVIDSR
jgi:hypothetical protein